MLDVSGSSINTTAAATPLGRHSHGARQARVRCLMGRNGVGKTTLLKSIMGLLAGSLGRDHVIRRQEPAARPR